MTLEKAENEIIRKMHGYYFWNMSGILNTIDIHLEDKRIPMSLELRYASIMWFGHTLRRDSDSLTRKALLGRFLPSLLPVNVHYKTIH